MANYNFVIDSSFKPFSFQEMLAPYAIYKEAYDKAEDRYYEMKNRANKFKYLSTVLPEGSEARRIYEGFANDLEARSKEFLQHGLTMGTKNAITDLRGRIQGEIGMLEDAKTALDEARRVRDARMAQDPSMKYATKDLSIDQFLYDRRPNMYSVSGDDIYKRGIVAGQSASNRVYNFNGENKTMGEYYYDLMESYGWKPEGNISFREQMKDNPDMREALKATLTEKGVYKNITDQDDLEATIDAFINGWCDGAIYKVTHNIQRNPGKPSWAEEQQAAYQSRMAAVNEGELNLKKTMYQDQKDRQDIFDKYYFKYDENGKKVGLNEEFLKSQGITYDPVSGDFKKQKEETKTDEQKKEEKEVAKVDDALLSIGASFDKAKEKFVNDKYYGRYFSVDIKTDNPATGGKDIVKKGYSLIGGVDRHHQFWWQPNSRSDWFRMTCLVSTDADHHMRIPDYPHRGGPGTTSSNLVTPDGHLGINTDKNGFTPESYPKLLSASEKMTALNNSAVKEQVDGVIKDFRQNLKEGGVNIPDGVDIKYELVRVPNKTQSRNSYLVYTDLDKIQEDIINYYQNH